MLEAQFSCVWAHIPACAPEPEEHWTSPSLYPELAVPGKHPVGGEQLSWEQFRALQKLVYRQFELGGANQFWGCVGSYGTEK
jgi:hypothetical protein